MGRGRVDYRQLAEFTRKLERLSERKARQFSESAVKELVAKLLRNVILRTPTGIYNTPGKVGGTLRRGWTSKTHQEAQDRRDNGELTQAYIDSLAVERRGDTYIIHVINPVNYANYVEYGHRKGKDGRKGWQPGQFMMTKSEIELYDHMPGILERKLERFLRDELG